MRFLLFSIIVFVAFAALAIIIAKLLNVGMDWRDATYKLIAGAPKTAIVDFATLKRRSSPNDALACPQDRCAAKPDRVTNPDRRTRQAIWTVIEGALFARAEAITLASQATDAEEETRVYLIRTPLMRFPDVLQVTLGTAKDAGTSIAMYSASQIGYGDMGANLARIDALLKALEAQP
jgi:uncharacterized protein (DUF1499 family)